MSMRFSAICFSLSIAFLFSACSTFNRKRLRPSITLPDSYRLVWQDNFKDHQLNLKKWQPLVRVRDDARDDSAAITVANGLKITTYTENGVNHTGFLSTRGLFEPKFGYFEASINFHDSPGEWCAFWLQSPTLGEPVDNPEKAGMEIDVTEHRSINSRGVSIQKSTRMGALHWNGYGPFEKDIRSRPVSPPDGTSCQDHYHTYGVLWTAAGYQFYIDGKQVVNHPVGANPVSHSNEFIYLSCEVEDHDWAGRVPAIGYGDRTHSHTGMDVAWVRVWQAKPATTKKSLVRDN